MSGELAEQPVWANPGPAELADHLVAYHGYPAAQVPEDPEQAQRQHAADHRYCGGVKGAKSGSVDQVFIRHVHAKGKA